MADVKISALPAATSANTTDELPANQAGTTRKVTVEQLHEKFVLARDSNTVLVNNSTTTTSIYSCTIPANALAADRTAHTYLLGQYWHSVGASATLTLRVGYSTTTMYQENTTTFTASSTSRPIIIDLYLSNKSATNSQQLGGIVFISGTGGATTGWGDLAASATIVADIRGTAAIDSTSARTFEVFVTHSTASTLVSFEKLYAFTELI